MLPNKAMAHSISPLRSADVRRRNEKIVLRLIHSSRERGLSQSEVVIATGLKPPTIFRIFSYLDEAGYIEPLLRVEDEARQDKKGRRPLAYRARRAVFYTIGVEFWVERLSLGIFDFQGQSIYSRLMPLEQLEDATSVTDLIAFLVEEGIAALNLPRDRILGLGIGAPGQVNVGSREVASYPRIAGMKDFPIAALLEAKLGIAVSLHNNCSVIAQSEFRYGALGDEDSMFMFLLRSGVNGAFVEGGRVFLSPRGTTIEMGHISIDFDGPRCVCGARGCLEAFITSLDRENLGAGKWLFEGQCADADSGSAAMLDKAATYLAAAVQTVSRLFRPSSFLFVACSEAVASDLARRVGERLRSARSSFDVVEPRLLGRAYDEVLAQRGAADLVMDHFLS